MLRKHLQYKLECIFKREKLVFWLKLIFFYQLVVKNVIDKSQQQVYFINHYLYDLLGFNAQIETHKWRKKHEYCGEWCHELMRYIWLVVRLYLVLIILQDLMIELKWLNVMGHVIEIYGYSLFVHKCYALHTDLRELCLLIWLLKQVLNFLRADFNLIDAALLRRFVYLRYYYLIQAYGNIFWIFD